MKLLAQTLLAGSAVLATARAVSFTVSSSGGNVSSPYQYGIMFEDINHSGDGGVYAELVQNRAFQGNTIYPSNLDYWYSIGGAELSLSNLSKPLSSALPTCMTVNVPKGSKGDVGFWNEGWCCVFYCGTMRLTLYRILGLSYRINMEIQWLFLHERLLQRHNHCHFVLKYDQQAVCFGFRQSKVDQQCLDSVLLHSQPDSKRT